MNERWTESDKLDQLAAAFEKDRQWILNAAAVMLAIIGFYAVFVFCSWMLHMVIRYVRDNVPGNEGFLENLKNNFLFLLSAAAFFSMNVSLDIGYGYAWAAACPA